MTNTPLDYGECEEQRRNLLANGLKKGRLDKEQIEKLIALESRMDILRPRRGIYDPERTCREMLIAHLKKVGKPMPLGELCRVVEKNNSFWEYRNLRDAGTLGVEKGHFLNVVKPGDDDTFVLALREWYREPPPVPRPRPKRRAL